MKLRCRVGIRNFLIVVGGLTVLFSSCGSKSQVSPPPNREKWGVVIIGAGAGGLSAGATLAQAGVKTLVLEQHDKPGGYMTAFTRGDYRFEVSLHMMDGLDEGGMTRDLFRKLDILDRVKPIKFDPLYRGVFPDFVIDVPADYNQYLKLLEEMFPHEAQGIGNLFRDLNIIGDDVMALSRLMDRFFLLRWLTYPLVPVLYWDFVKNYQATLDDFIARYLSDPKAKAVILELASFMGLPPSRTPAVIFAVLFQSYYRRGVYQFVGGSQAVSNALVEVIQEKGGEVRLNTRVKKILIHNREAVGVLTESGEEIYADAVISNADGYSTYLKLVGEENLSPKFVRYVKSLEPGVSTTQVFLGLNLDLHQVGLGSIGEIFYNPSYEIESFWKSIETMDIENSLMTISLFSNTDPTSAPPGKSVVSVTIGSLYDWEDQWRIKQGYEAYRALKEEVGERMLKVAEKLIPGLRPAIEEMEISTPLTNERYTSNYKGSIVGWAYTPEQSLLRRMKPKTPIKNLYLAGAWTFPGGGQSACLMSGYLTANLVLAKLR